MSRIARNLRHLVIGAALLTVMACKPSVEGETRAWDQNKLTLQEWVGKFPNFRAAVDQRLQEAQADFDAAKVIADADQRAEKMREANNKVGVLTSAFQEIDRKLREYETLKRDPTLATLPGQLLMPALQMSDSILREARMRMDGPVANAGEALGRLKDASAMIDRARAPLQNARDQAAQRPNPGGGQPPPGAAPGQPAVPPAAGMPGSSAPMPGAMGPGAQLGMPPGAGGPGMRPSMGPAGSGVAPAMGPGAGVRPGMGTRPGQPMVQGAGGPPPGMVPAGAPPTGAPAAGSGAPPPAAPAGGRPF